MSDKPTFEGPVNNNAARYIIATGVVPAEVASPGASGMRVKGLSATNGQATQSVNVHLYLKRGGISYLVSTTGVPPGSGTDGSPASLLDDPDNNPWISRDSSNNPVIELMATDTLEVAPDAAMTEVGNLDIVMLGRDF